MLWCSGWLLIAEVRSRFDPNNGGADPEKFSEAVKYLGFSLVSKVCLSELLFFMHALRFLNYINDLYGVSAIVFCYCMLMHNNQFMQDFTNKMFVLFYFKKKVRRTIFAKCNFRYFLSK